MNLGTHTCPLFIRDQIQMMTSITIYHPDFNIIVDYRLQLKQKVTGTQSILDLYFCVKKARENSKHFKARYLNYKKALMKLYQHFSLLSSQIKYMSACDWKDMYIFFLTVFYGEFEVLYLLCF